MSNWATDWRLWGGSGFSRVRVQEDPDRVVLRYDETGELWVDARGAFGPDTVRGSSHPILGRLCIWVASHRYVPLWVDALDEGLGAHGPDAYAFVRLVARNRELQQALLAARELGGSEACEALVASHGIKSASQRDEERAAALEGRLW